MENTKRNIHALHVNEPRPKVTPRCDVCSRSRIKHSRVRKLLSTRIHIQKSTKSKKKERLK